MKKTILLVLVVIMSGCSAFQDATQSVKINCVQPNTSIIVNGVKNACPATLDLPRDRTTLIEASKPGHIPSVRQIGYHLGETGKLDLLGTVLLGVPVIGLMTSGAWDLDHTEINIDLNKI